jgi:hypothetical protein
MKAAPQLSSAPAPATAVPAAKAAAKKSKKSSAAVAVAAATLDPADEVRPLQAQAALVAVVCPTIDVAALPKELQAAFHLDAAQKTHARLPQLSERLHSVLEGSLLSPALRSAFDDGTISVSSLWKRGRSRVAGIASVEELSAQILVRALALRDQNRSRGEKKYGSVPLCCLLSLWLSSVLPSFKDVVTNQAQQS